MFSVFKETSPRGDEDVSRLHNTTDAPSSDKTHHRPEDVGGGSPLPRFPPLRADSFLSHRGGECGHRETKKVLHFTSGHFH